MDDQSYHVRVPKRWARIAMIVGATALIVAPLTAVATHSFTDVPNDNTFHADIEWLKNAGVTLGCNPPTNNLYCPKDNVTREQMSAFMRRLAQYMGAEDGTPAQADNAVNADTVDGQHANDLATVVAGTFRDWRGGGSPNIGTTPENLMSTTLSAPTTGFGLVIARANVFQTLTSPNPSDDYTIWAQLDDNTCSIADSLDGSESWGSVSDDVTYQEQAAMLVVPVSQGVHTLTLCAMVATANGGIQLIDASINAVFSRNGSSIEVANASSGSEPLSGTPEDNE